MDLWHKKRRTQGFKLPHALIKSYLYPPLSYFQQLSFLYPLFLAKDVAEWLGNDSSQLKKMLDKVDEDEKCRNNITTLGGVQNTWFLTEQGLYDVINN